MATAWDDFFLNKLCKCCRFHEVVTTQSLTSHNKLIWIILIFLIINFRVTCRVVLLPNFYYSVIKLKLPVYLFWMNKEYITVRGVYAFNLKNTFMNHIISFHVGYISLIKIFTLHKIYLCITCVVACTYFV